MIEKNYYSCCSYTADYSSASVFTLMKPGMKAVLRIKIRLNTLKLAEDYYKQKEYQRALDLLDKVLINNPDDEDAKNLRDRINCC